jgi:hypothetical protein
MPFDGSSMSVPDIIEFLSQQQPWDIRILPYDPTRAERATRQAKHARLQKRAAASVRMLDGLIDLFDCGKHWIKDADTDHNGNYCLRGGMEHLRRKQGRGDATGIYLRRAIALECGQSMRVPRFNDTCADFEQVRRVIVCARKLAAADGGHIAG